jgi:hypothetical protein
MLGADRKHRTRPGPVYEQADILHWTGDCPFVQLSEHLGLHIMEVQVRAADITAAMHAGCMTGSIVGFRDRPQRQTGILTEKELGGR